VKAEPTKVTHDNHVRPRHILRQEWSWKCLGIYRI